MFELGIVGCGVIGSRRAAAIPASAKIIGCFDTDAGKASELASRTDAKACRAFEDLLALRPHGIVIATVNSALAGYAQACQDAGIHVLVEKPAARSAAELEGIRRNPATVFKIGFNHRFHPAYRDLKQEILRRPDDPILFIRAQYGNGARVGFDQEWRSQVNLAGGGELLDQGVHVLDLAGGLLPRLQVKTAWCRTHFWDMEVDDNAWAILSSPEGQTFSMHVSSTEWKNEFRFEVYTRRAKYVWAGLGRSYGPEKLTIYRMKPEMGPPDVEERSYPGEDTSWLLENTNFVDSCSGRSSADGVYEDALRSLGWVQAIYESSSRLEHTTRHPVWWKS